MPTHSDTGPALDVRTLLAVMVIIAAVQVVGRLARLIRQPEVIGEIVAGIVLGPSVLGAIAPAVATQVFPPAVVEALRVLAQFGLILFMVLVGLEFRPGAMRGCGGKVAMIAQACVVVPMLLAVPLALVLYPRLGVGVNRLAFCLFVATALCVTAFPVLARLLAETGLSRTRVGSLSLTCAALNDAVAWVLLAVVTAVVHASGPAGVLRMLALMVGLTVVILGVVRPLLARLPDLPLWATVLLGLLAAWASQAVGGHVVLGAFLAGAAMPRRPQWLESVELRLHGVVSVLLLPIFFALVGLSTRMDLLDSGWLWGVVALVVVTATVGKFVGAAVAARLAGERGWDAVTIGVLMNTRGLTEVVVLTVGLQLHVITPTMFTVMVLMALVTTLAAAPALHLIAWCRRTVAAEADGGGTRELSAASRPA